MNKLHADENVLILDLQGGTKQSKGLMAIPGAIRIDPHLLQRYERYLNPNLPTHREVILYCSYRSEFMSARVAMTLHEEGSKMFDLLRADWRPGASNSLLHQISRS